MLQTRGMTWVGRVIASQRQACRFRVQTSQNPLWSGRMFSSNLSQRNSEVNGKNLEREVNTKPRMSTKLTWADRVKSTNISAGKYTLADLYSAARNPSSLSDPLRARLPTLPQRAKGHPTPCLTCEEIVGILAPLCMQSGWAVEFRLPAESEPERSIPEDCGCGPEAEYNEKETPFLRKTYQFASIQATDDFLADSKLLSDIGEFHHFDSYSLSPSSGNFGLSSPASLTTYLQTHSAIKASGVSAPGITMRDIRYSILLDHLYHSSYATGARVDDVASRTLDGDLIRRLLL